MEILYWLLSLLIAHSTVSSVSADSIFLTGNSSFNPEIISYPAVEKTFFEDCNLRPETYKKWKGKINSYNCINCYDEYIVGNSMNPTLYSYDNLIFDRNRTPIIGDIIEYDKRMELTGINYTWTKNNNIIHRVVAMQGNNYVVLGDNNSFCELIPNDAVFGVLAGS